MAATIEPPASAAPPAGVTIVDTGPPKAPPAPTTTIRVSDMPTTATPAEIKSGSAMDRLRQDLAKKAKNVTPEPEAPKPAVTPKAKPSPEVPGDGEEPGEGAPQPDPGSTPPAEGTPPAATDPKGTKPGKANPWKLVDQYKQRTAELEKQIAEAKTGALAETEKKNYLTQIEQLAKRKQELEDEIRFVNYSKSEEYQTKYQAPYEAAWKRAMAELSEVPVIVNAQTGETRQVTAEDLGTLVNLPLGKARDVAEAAFGKFADDVLDYRKEIRALFDAQNAALAEAKTKGAEREKQTRELTQKQQQDLADFTRTTWEKVNKDAASDPKYGKYFTPVEGDQEGNQRLAKGFELVDRAFNENPSDPSLTPDQRASIIKRHAAIRNRAAGFGRVLYMLEQAQAKAEALEKELAAFKSSTPSAGGGTTPAAAPGRPASAREEIFANLRKIAKP